MTDDDTLMAREAHESADVLARQRLANEAVVSRLTATLRAQPPRCVVTCTRGSSDHAAAFAKYAFESFYRAVSALALRRGFNPDVPPHLDKVTETM